MAIPGTTESGHCRGQDMGDAIDSVRGIRTGTFGDWKVVGEGVFELQIDRGSGYRIYLGRNAMKEVILLTGGEVAGSGHRESEGPT